MQYQITDLKKTDAKRVEICLNGEIFLWLYQGEARSLSLTKGMILSEEQYENLLHGVIGKRAIKRAVHLIERQERTERQLREKLSLSEYPEDAVSYVKKRRYLDDERYTRTFIRFHQTERSKMRLKSDLIKRGVSKDVIERCIEEEFSSDEKAQIRALLEKKGFSQSEADRNESRKMYQFLMRRGFRSSDILAVMNQNEDA